MTTSPVLTRKAEAGYNLVVLAIAITVLNIGVAAMLPLWSTAIKREKEEELIFRGFQYAEAIRVFHMRYQRYPNKLDELIKVKPRSIRQLWKDPMTDDGQWGLIFENQPQGLQGQLNDGQGKGDGDGGRKGGGGGDKGGGDGDGDGDIDDSGRPLLGARKGEVVQVGPIIGVRSKSSEKSMLILFGRERYDEWQFTESQLMGGGGGAGGLNFPQAQPTQPAQAGLQFSTRWLGRPMGGFNQQPGEVLPQDGTLPDGTTPGGTPPKPRKPGGTSKPRGLP
jgi:hypothetical protein